MQGLKSVRPEWGFAVPVCRPGHSESGTRQTSARTRRNLHRVPAWAWSLTETECESMRNYFDEPVAMPTIAIQSARNGLPSFLKRGSPDRLLIANGEELATLKAGSI